jgi:hypothetical protein
VGAHFGLTPKKYQSGETNISGRISVITLAPPRSSDDHRPAHSFMPPLLLINCARLCASG